MVQMVLTDFTSETAKMELAKESKIIRAEPGRTKAKRINNQTFKQVFWMENLL
jgi:hypothetical protein